MPDQLLIQITAQGPMTYEEIARTLGLHPQTVREAERRAIRKLRAAIKTDPALRDCLLAHLENEASPRQNLMQVIRDMERERGTGDGE